MIYEVASALRIAYGCRFQNPNAMICRALAICFSVIILHTQLIAQTAAPAPAAASKPGAEAKPAGAKPAAKPATPAKKPAAPAAKPEPEPEKKGFRFPWSKKDKPVPAPAAAVVPEAPKKPKPPVDNFKTYMTKVKAALGKRWADAVQPRMDEFTPGNVSCSFKLDAAGQVASFAISANSSNEAFGKFCEGFVKETPFEAPPEKLLVEGQLEIPFTFWIY